MKKILLILMAMFAFGIQNVSAQDAPLKIVTNHPDFKLTATISVCYLDIYITFLINVAFIIVCFSTTW